MINRKKGFTLVEVLVGIGLLAVVFTGILGVYRLGLKVVGLSKNKITATAIANQYIETVHNLSYQQVGTQGAVLPYASGILEALSTKKRNNVDYTIETKVKYISDPTDGTGQGDSCNLDYKKVDIKVSWATSFNGSITLSTNVSPKNQIEEVQACQSQPGGILAVTVFDAFGAFVPSPLIEIIDTTTGNLIDSATPDSGQYSFPLAAASYKVAVSKASYSSERSYGTDEVATPFISHPTVFEGKLTDSSFSIDRAASFSVDALSPVGQDFFSDTFDDDSKISENSNIDINSGKIILSGSPYLDSGYVVSGAINPLDLVAWNDFTFSDNEPPSTKISYQFLYFNGSDWILIPDQDLSGNSSGFENSPILLSGLDTVIYPQLKIRGVLVTTDDQFTPELYNWQVSWTTNQGPAVGNAQFTLQGEKYIGKDINEQKVYKYSQTHILDSGGHLDLSGLEWDQYTFASLPSSGLSLLGIEPAPQPVNLDPDSSVSVNLYLSAQDYLVLTLQDDVSLAPVFAASIRLWNNSLGYDKTQNTDQKGQTLFTPLQAAIYDLEITAPGYAGYSGTVSVSGQSISNIQLHQVE